MERFGYPLLAVVLLGLAACAVTPETPRERLVAAETTYQAAVATVRDLALAGRITQEQAPRVRAAIVAARTSLDLWHANPDGSAAMQAALSSIAVLQSILNQIAPPSTERAAPPKRSMEA
jgi:hypothetical protein